MKKKRTKRITKRQGSQRKKSSPPKLNNESVAPSIPLASSNIKSSKFFTSQMSLELSIHSPFLLGILFAVGKTVEFSVASSTILFEVVVLFVYGLRNQSISTARGMLLLYFIGLFYLYSQTEDAVLVGTMLLLLFLGVVFRFYQQGSLRRAIAMISSLISFSSLLGVIGVYALSSQFHWQALFIGFVTGGICASAKLLNYAKDLEKLGYGYFIEKLSKAGKPLRRPGVITKLYTIPLIFGIGLSLAVIPINVVPMSFLIQVVTIYFAFKLSEACFEQKGTIELIQEKTVKLSYLSVALMVVAAMI